MFSTLLWAVFLLFVISLCAHFLTLAADADGAVFRGTLADNIRYQRPEATDTEVRAT